MHKIIATVFGVGYIGKGSGTIAAILCCIVWYLTGGGNPVIEAVVTLLITGVGVWSATVVEKYWGVDSNRVVIDEVAGMCISMLFLPVTWFSVLLALLLFRFFDIVKPLYIRKAENLPGGIGVMADDVLAGVYTNILMQVAAQVSLL